MKGHYWVIIAGLMLMLCGVCQAETVPHQVGGFVLGGEIDSYKSHLDMASDMPIRHLESVREVEIRGVPGFKSGLIAYGTCHAPGKIVRIKLKYSEPGKKLYEQLLKRFKKKFGDPDEWRGDPFGIVLAWKWSFTDSQNNKISMTLQHNTRDMEEKIGNSVKLTLTSQLEKEKKCLHDRISKSKAPSKPSKPSSKKPVNWDLLMPR
jgi:hypothetical protein